MRAHKELVYIADVSDSQDEGIYAIPPAVMQNNTYVIRVAHSQSAQLILVFHSVFFDPLKREATGLIPFGALARGNSSMSFGRVDLLR